MEKKGERKRFTNVHPNQYLCLSPLLLQKALVSALWCPLLTGVEIHRIQSMPVIITVWLGPKCTQKECLTAPALYQIWSWSYYYTENHIYSKNDVSPADCSADLFIFSSYELNAIPFLVIQLMKKTRRLLSPKVYSHIAIEATTYTR